MIGQVAEDLANVIKSNSDLKELYLSNDDLKTSTILISQSLSENFTLNVLI